MCQLTHGAQVARVQGKKNACRNATFKANINKLPACQLACHMSQPTASRPTNQQANSAAMRRAYEKLHWERETEVESGMREFCIWVVQIIVHDWIFAVGRATAESFDPISPLSFRPAASN